MEERLTITPGIYEHYKGKRYKVLGTATHSETLEQMVIYEPLYECDIPGNFVRPLEMFMENVEVDGISRPRFLLIHEPKNEN